MTEVVGIVGAGTMGAGIAELAARAGFAVRLHDAAPGRAEDAVARLRERFAALAARDRIAAADGAVRSAPVAAVAAADAAAWSAAVAAVGSLEELADAEVVVEAVVEDLDAKVALLRALDDVVAPDALLASNTSSLSISELALATRHPARIVGLHFFNPPTRMRVVEVVPGHATGDDAVRRATAFAERLGQRAIVAADAPGFVVNHAGRAMVTEALRILEERVADPATLDRIVRDGAGFPMGPCELMDLTGLDVSHRVMESIFEQHYDDPRYRPSTLALRRVRAGLLGRKTGGGFHRYPREDATERGGAAGAARPVSLRAHPSLPPTWRALAARISAGEGDPVLLIAPLGEDASTFVARERLPAARTVAIDPLLEPDRLAVLMGTPATEPAALDDAAATFERAGVATARIADSPGFVVQRIAAMIVNTGTAIAEAGIASPADVDAAVELGLGYPLGPFALGERLGADTVRRILEGIAAATGDPRYRPTLWLRRRAQLDLPIASAG
jgi:3-hydroxybutyryl-CoA dehydrogenase